MRATGIEVTKYSVSYDPSKATVVPDIVFQRGGSGTGTDLLYNALHPGVMRARRRIMYWYLLSSQPWEPQMDAMLNLAKNDFDGFEVDWEQGGNVMSPTFAGMGVESVKYVRKQSGKRTLLYAGMYDYRDLILRYFPVDAPTLDYTVPFYYTNFLGQQIVPDPQVKNPPMLPSRTNWNFWQYAAGEHNKLGAQYGVGSAGVELDVFNGTVDELDAWLGLPATQPAPVPTPAPVTLESLAAEVTDLQGRVGRLEAKP